MVELDPNYVQIIIKRFSNYTDNKKTIKCLNRKLDLSKIIEENTDTKT